MAVGGIALIVTTHRLNLKHNLGCSEKNKKKSELNFLPIPIKKII